MKHIVKLNIYQAINRLEGENQRRYSDNEIARLTGLHRHTVALIRKGRDDKLLAGLLNFFASEGMPVTIADLFSVTTVPDLANTGQASATLAPATLSATGKLSNTVSD
ncbi:MAG TPA: hypothetical protein VNJ01_03635 [Bacteriovoracaceae bacterium]|nr:hypothetical protein [Bacteriovoracaceae bacterium]